MNHEQPASAYIHVPFCRHRCGYCNFTLIAGRDDLIADFLRAIEIELSGLEEPRPVETLFYGGGTPTHLPLQDLVRFFQLTQHWFPPKDDAEVSVEANPEDIDAEVCEALRQAGVTRVSLGVQSFRQQKLNALERAHTAEMVRACVDTLRPVIASLSIDLIFAAPHETLPQWQHDVRQALELPIDHLSTYGLTYEQNTSFFARRDRGELPAANEDLELAMYEFAIDELNSAGLEHYEVSNFAYPGHRCRHNENYWFCRPFYGVGPGAARFVQGKRESNYRSTTKYLKQVLAGASPTEESESLTDDAAARERLVFGLRRLDGVNLDAFADTTGQQVQALAIESLPMLLDEGLLEMTAEKIRLTRKGLLVSDAIWPHLL